MIRRKAEEPGLMKGTARGIWYTVRACAPSVRDSSIKDHCDGGKKMSVQPHEQPHDVIGLQRKSLPTTNAVPALLDRSLVEDSRQPGRFWSNRAILVVACVRQGGSGR